MLKLLFWTFIIVGGLYYFAPETYKALFGWL